MGLVFLTPIAEFWILPIILCDARSKCCKKEKEGMINQGATGLDLVIPSGLAAVIPSGLEYIILIRHINGPSKFFSLGLVVNLLNGNIVLLAPSHRNSRIQII